MNLFDLKIVYYTFACKKKVTLNATDNMGILIAAPINLIFRTT